MFRKSILASTLSLLLLPRGTGALGLGGIRPESALNQPFAGEIDLIGANPDQLDAVKVLLAPEAEFAKRGTERQHYLTKLRFKPQVSPHGKIVVRVTSTEAIREPYMDFLVEVIWPKGRLVKGYTVLLDPPVTARRSPPPGAPPVAMSPVGAAPATASKSAGRSAVASTTTPMLTSPARSATPPVPAVGSPADFPLRSLPIKSGTGLWRLARQMTPAGATVPQTAMALYRNNQQAFVRGNIHKLRQGKVLQIPTSAELFALDAGTAQREFRLALSGKRVTASPLTDGIAAASAEESRLKIAGATPPAEPPTAPTEGQATAPSGAPTPPDIEQELLLVRETGESTRQETDELRARVRQLESSLADIQQLLTLRNAELARLQGTQGTTPTLTEAESETAAPTDGQRPAGGPSEGVAETGVPVDGTVGPRAATEGSVQVAGTVPAAGEPATPADPPSTPPETSRSSWLDNVPLVGGALKTLPTPVLWSGLVAAPLLGALGWLSVRRRRIEEGASEFGLRSSPSLKDQPASMDAPIPTTGQASDGPESEEPSLSRASGSGHPAVGSPDEDGEASDIISEADIYMAYGRYRDAEDLLKQAIARFPRRADLRYRLADVYAGARNTEGLAALIAEMEQAGMDKEDPEQWSRLMDPTKFAGERPTAPVASAAGAAAPVTALGLVGLAPGGAAERDGGALRGVAGARDTYAERHHLASLGDRDSLLLDGLDSLVGEESRQQHPSLGFETLDLGPVATTGEVVVLGKNPNPVSRLVGARDADLDLELNMLDLTPTIEVDLSDSANAPSLDLEQGLSLQTIDLDVLPGVDPVGGTLPSTDDLAKAWAEPIPAAGGPMRGLGSGPERTRPELDPIGQDSVWSDVSSSQWQMEGGVWDEAETKLDLGRAYVEMDDRQAAEVLLLEVAGEGSPDQQVEARKLLAKLKPG